MTTLVIAPIPQEFEVLARVFEQRWGSPEKRGVGRTDVHEYRATDVILAEGGFGKVQFAVTTRHLLDHLPGVSLVVCAGVAGALADSVRVGDVVVGTATIEHDFYSVVLRGVHPSSMALGGTLPSSFGTSGPIKDPSRSTSPRSPAVTRPSWTLAGGAKSMPARRGLRSRSRAREEQGRRLFRKSPTSRYEGFLTWPTTTSLANLKPTSRTPWRTSPPSSPGWPNTPFPQQKPRRRSEAPRPPPVPRSAHRSWWLQRERFAHEFRPSRARTHRVRHQQERGVLHLSAWVRRDVRPSRGALRLS